MRVWLRSLVIVAIGMPIMVWSGLADHWWALVIFWAVMLPWAIAGGYRDARDRRARRQAFRELWRSARSD